MLRVLARVVVSLAVGAAVVEAIAFLSRPFRLGVVATVVVVKLLSELRANRPAKGGG